MSSTNETQKATEPMVTKETNEPLEKEPTVQIEQNTREIHVVVRSFNFGLDLDCDLDRPCNKCKGVRDTFLRKGEFTCNCSEDEDD